MKRLIVIIAAFVYFLESFAQEIDRSIKYEIKILERLVIDVTKKRHPSVYTDGLDNRKVYLLQMYSNLRIAPNITEADFVFIKNKKEKYNAIKPTLALDFTSIRNCDLCIGVFSWRNGRPILILFKENLQKYNIKLPKEYRYFIESKKYIIGKK
ncbi:hypothetical protein SAMN06265182_1038 [Persephonella hydrogeniphila]|uniref:Uncharacterized protein n=1 Tax=Persephonella hydrogeniphila TaxID=198703 RepID=A0A285NG08_9AQUI|nr:hypothetical protein [Persephonella hydrogeniphila]SNZ07823.1 hypothetical protein SAMN06265182_1038 [Persephonella hydrogeniphila]